MVALLLLIIRVFFYVNSLNDDCFAYQRSAGGVVLYVQVKCHTLLSKNPINDLLIIYYLLIMIMIYVPNAHTIPLCSPTPSSYSS